MSILPLLLLVGVATCKHVGSHGNDAVLQPIVSKSQTHRICASLCTAGLGGESCGDGCLDIVPQGLPLQSPNSSQATGGDADARRDACPVLCENGLGRPLCDCALEIRPAKDVDFVQICGVFCMKYVYQIDGCQSCDVYKRASISVGPQVFGATQRRMAKLTVDWEEWCKQKCIAGDGGVACNCDILPISITF